MTITAAIYGQRFENILARLNELMLTPSLQGTDIAAKLEHDLKEFTERGFLTNKVRLCERSEPQSEPVVGQARWWKADFIIRK
jgi:hypothetical protein